MLILPSFFAVLLLNFWFSNGQVTEAQKWYSVMLSAELTRQESGAQTKQQTEANIKKLMSVGVLREKSVEWLATCLGKLEEGLKNGSDSAPAPDVTLIQKGQTTSLSFLCFVLLTFSLWSGWLQIYGHIFEKKYRLESVDYINKLDPVRVQGMLASQEAETAAEEGIPSVLPSSKPKKRKKASKENAKRKKKSKAPADPLPVSSINLCQDEVVSRTLAQASSAVVSVAPPSSVVSATTTPQASPPTPASVASALVPPGFGTSIPMVAPLSFLPFSIASFQLHDQLLNPLFVPMPMAVQPGQSSGKRESSQLELPSASSQKKKKKR